MRSRGSRLRTWVGSWLRLFPQAALVLCGVGALRFVEVLVSPPPHGATPLAVLALAAGSLFWLAGAALGLVALAAWAVRRGVAAPVVAKPTTDSPSPSWEVRFRGWGVNIVIAWLGLGFLVLIVMSDTATGPFAWFATEVLGLRDFAGVATFLLGLPAFAAPLVLLAMLPWQTRWPLIAGMQAAVKPVPQARKRRRRR